MWNVYYRPLEYLIMSREFIKAFDREIQGRSQHVYTINPSNLDRYSIIIIELEHSETNFLIVIDIKLSKCIKTKLIKLWV